MLRSSRPDNALDAKFSAQFTVASALQRGRLGLAELTDASVNDPAIQALIGKIRVVAIDERDPAFLAWIRGVRGRWGQRREQGD